jgi:putative ABC transport system permease protein
MRSWELFLLALGNIRRRPLRVGLTVSGVAIAVGAMVSMLGYGLGIHGLLDVSVEKLGLLHRIEVTPGGGGSSRARKPLADVATPAPAILDDEALARVAAIPGVAAAYPLFRIAGVIAARDGRSSEAITVGLPPDALGASLLEGLLVAGRLFSRDGGAEALIGRELDRALGFESPEAALGSTIELRAAGFSPQAGADFTLEERKVEVRICGVFEVPPFAFGLGRDAIIVPAEVARGLPGSHLESAIARLRSGGDPSTPGAGYAQIVVRVANLLELDRVENDIRAMGFATRALMGEVQELRKWFLLEKGMIFAVGTVALVVAGLGIMNTLLMSVLERFREIGLYKALGASDGDVRLIFLAEAGAVGLAGGLGGLGLGLAVSSVIEVLFNRYARSLGIDEFLGTFRFPLWLLGGAVAFALLVSVLSGVYPSHRAARVDPIEALRGE